MIQVAIAATTISPNRIVYADGSENPLFSGSGSGWTAVSLMPASPNSIPSASRVTTVPVSPRSRAGVSTIEPIAAKPPVSSTNEHAARTFGPIEPAANSVLPSASGVARRIARWSGVPQPS